MLENKQGNFIFYHQQAVILKGKILSIIELRSNKNLCGELQRSAKCERSVMNGVFLNIEISKCLKALPTIQNDHHQFKHVVSTCSLRSHFQAARIQKFFNFLPFFIFIYKLDLLNYMHLIFSHKTDDKYENVFQGNNIDKTKIDGF